MSARATAAASCLRRSLGLSARNWSSRSRGVGAFSQSSFRQAASASSIRAPGLLCAGGFPVVGVHAFGHVPGGGDLDRQGSVRLSAEDGRGHLVRGEVEGELQVALQPRLDDGGADPAQIVRQAQPEARVLGRRGALVGLGVVVLRRAVSAAGRGRRRAAAVRGGRRVFPLVARACPRRRVRRDAGGGVGSASAPSVLSAGGRGLGGRVGGVRGRARRRGCGHEVFVLPAHQAPVNDQVALAADRDDASGAGHQLGAVRLAGVHLVVEGLGFGLQLLDLGSEPVALGRVAGASPRA